MTASAIGRTRFWAAVATSASTAAALALGVTTPPRSGPYCAQGCVGYPYTDVAAFVPRDYLWMYPAILSVAAFVLLAACLHELVSTGRRAMSGAGLCLTAIGAGVLMIDYAIQLMVMQPSLGSGETEGLSPWSQYNPHGIFIGLENLGYATLGLAFLLLAAALSGQRSRLVRATAWVFGGGGAVTLLLLILYGAVYRARLEYRFEVVSLSVTWLALIVSGVLLGIAFARASGDAHSVSSPGSADRIDEPVG